MNYVRNVEYVLVWLYTNSDRASLDPWPLGSVFRLLLSGDDGSVFPSLVMHLFTIKAHERRQSPFWELTLDYSHSFHRCINTATWLSRADWYNPMHSSVREQRVTTKAPLKCVNTSRRTIIKRQQTSAERQKTRDKLTMWMWTWTWSASAENQTEAACQTLARCLHGQHGAARALARSLHTA